MPEILSTFDDHRYSSPDSELVGNTMNLSIGIEVNNNQEHLIVANFLKCYESETTTDLLYAQSTVDVDDISDAHSKTKFCPLLYATDDSSLSAYSEDFNVMSNYKGASVNNLLLHPRLGGPDDEKIDDEVDDEKLRMFQKSLSHSTNIEWIKKSLPYHKATKLHLRRQKSLRNSNEYNQTCHPFLDCPGVVMLSILSFLDDNSLRMVQRVNRSMRDFLIKVSESKTLVWTQACRQRWPWLDYFLSDDIVTENNRKKSKIVFVDSLNLPIPLEIVTIDRTIINYGLLLSLAPSASSMPSRDNSTIITVGRSNQSSILLSSSISMMEIDDSKFVPTLYLPFYQLHFPFRNNDTPKFRFVKFGKPNATSEIDTRTTSEDDDAQYITTIQYIGNTGLGDRCIRTKQPFFRPELITNASAKLCPPSKKCRMKPRNRQWKVGFLKKLLQKRLISSRVSPDINGTQRVRAASKDLSASKSAELSSPKYVWKPFVIPFASSHCTRPEIKEMELMPRLVSYFEITILPQSFAGTINSGGGSQHRRGLNWNILQPNRDNNQVNEGSDCVAIGLADNSFPLNDIMPGWDTHSYGYHNDDGHVYHGSSSRSMINVQRRQNRHRRQTEIQPDNTYGPKYGVNDTVGCGIDYCNQSIFFTYNGTFLGYAFTDLSIEMLQTTTFYPVVGIDNNCPIYCNFGYKDPFAFNLSAYILKYQKDMLYQTLVF